MNPKVTITEEERPSRHHECPDAEPYHGEGWEDEFSPQQKEPHNQPVPPFAHHLTTPYRQIDHCTQVQLKGSSSTFRADGYLFLPVVAGGVV